MRIYIISNVGIALCREAPRPSMTARLLSHRKKSCTPPPLNGKRLLALWNALSGAEKRKKVGDRAALIDQLWSAIEMLPEPEPRGDPKPRSKQDVVIAMLRQPEGATVEEVASVTGWQRHTEARILSVPIQLRPCGRETKMLIEGTDPFATAKADARMIKLLIRARRFNATLLGADGVPFAALAKCEGVSPSYFTRFLRLSYLAPDNHPSYPRRAPAARSDCGQAAGALSAAHLARAADPARLRLIS